MSFSTKPILKVLSALGLISCVTYSSLSIAGSHVHNEHSDHHHTIPAKGMPAHIKAKLQERFTGEGSVEVIYEDFPDGRFELKHFVNTTNGRYRIHIFDNQKQFKSGQQVNFKGWLFDQNGEENIAVESDSDILIMGATGGDNGGTAGILPNTFGERKIAVFLVNFQDAPNDRPWTTTQVHNNLFGPVNDFIQETSYNQTWLSGDVFNWITLPEDGNTSCPSNYHLRVDQAAEAAGIDLSPYGHIMYMIPPNSACATNAGTVGSDGVSRAWIAQPLDQHIVAHEFGHNLGLSHAHSLNCEGGVLETNCLQSTYGDRLDVMGTNLGHMNAFNKELLGWLGHNQSPVITTVTTSGTYEIAPLESNSSDVKALKIPAGIDSVTGEQNWYFLEYRQPIGFDIEHFEEGYHRYPENLTNGVIFHQATGSQSNSSYLLDMTPDSIAGGYDLRDSALEVGQTYVDSVNGISITPLSNDAGGISVSVTIDGGAAPINTPPVAVADSATTNENSAVTINVVSNDSDADGDSLSITGTNGVNGHAQIIGDQITFTPNTGYVGTEVFSYSISDGNGGNASANVTVTVNSTNTAPVAQNDTAATTEGNAVTIAVLANDTDADGDTLTISNTSGVNGSAAISGDNIIFTPASGFSGTETFSYTINDGNGATDTASVTVTVTAVSSNNAPIAVNDSVQISSKSAVVIDVLSNDYDPENDQLLISSATNGSKGDVSVNNGVITYTPAKRFKDSDSFSYTISDGDKSATATVTVQLSGSSDGGSDGGSGGKGNGKKR